MPTPGFGVVKSKSSLLPVQIANTYLQSLELSTDASSKVAAANALLAGGDYQAREAKKSLNQKYLSGLLHRRCQSMLVVADMRVIAVTNIYGSSLRLASNKISPAVQISSNGKERW